MLSRFWVGVNDPGGKGAESRMSNKESQIVEVGLWPDPGLRRLGSGPPDERLLFMLLKIWHVSDNI